MNSNENAYKHARDLESKGEIMNAIRALEAFPSGTNLYYAAHLYSQLGHWRKSLKILRNPEVKAAADAEYNTFYTECRNRVKDSNAATFFFFGVSFISGFIIFFSTEKVSGGVFPTNHAINMWFLYTGVFFLLLGSVMKWLVRLK